MGKLIRFYFPVHRTQVQLTAQPKPLGNNLYVLPPLAEDQEAERLFELAFRAEAEPGCLTVALEAYRGRLERDPSNVQVMNSLGKVLFKLAKITNDSNLRRRRFAEAEELFKKAIEISPQFCLAHFNLAQLFYWRGRLLLAADLYRKILSIDFDFVDAHYGLAVLLLDLEEYQLAVRHLHKCAELRPGDQQILKLIDDLRPKTLQATKS